MKELAHEWRRGECVISTDSALLDLGIVHGFLKTSYWAAGVSEENVRRRVENSLVFGLYEGGEQIGFARVVTDYASFAYLADVFVVQPHQGRGLGSWLVETILAYPGLEDLKWFLATKDAHELYRSYGFTGLEIPGMYMEKRRPTAAGELPETGEVWPT